MAATILTKEVFRQAKKELTDADFQIEISGKPANGMREIAENILGILNTDLVTYDSADIDYTGIDLGDDIENVKQILIERAVWIAQGELELIDYDINQIDENFCFTVV